MVAHASNPRNRRLMQEANRLVLVSRSCLKTQNKTNFVYGNMDKIGVMLSGPGLCIILKKCLLTTVWACQHQILSSHSSKEFEVKIKVVLMFSKHLLSGPWNSFLSLHSLKVVTISHASFIKAWTPPFSMSPSWLNSLCSHQGEWRIKSYEHGCEAHTLRNY